MHTHSTRPKIIKAKSRAQREALHRLKAYLDKSNPKLIKILIRTWKDQGDAITYKELRESIMAGAMTETEFENWRQDYIKFFNETLEPILREICDENLKTIIDELAQANVTDLTIQRFNENMDTWINNYGSEFVTRMTDEGKKAISSMVHYSTSGNMTVDELARVIRPTIGLTKPQSIANAKYYEAVKSNLKEKLLTSNPKMKETTAEKQAAKRAQESAARYAARQHRYRAAMIAQTETAYAYNNAGLELVKQMVENGELPPMRKVWCTAADESVCPSCAALDGERVGLYEKFSNGLDVPPAHPICHCAVYEEPIL